MVMALFKWCIAVLVLIQFNLRPAQDGNPLPDRKVHPFYVSVTEINHNAKEGELEISCKMFADDFENTLKTEYKISFDIAHPKNQKQAESMVSAYLQKHLQLKINGNPVTMQFVGYEIENEAIWCY